MTPVWVVENDIILGYAGGGSVVNKQNVKIKGSEFIQWPFMEVSPGATFVKPRLEIMDQFGIWGQSSIRTRLDSEDRVLPRSRIQGCDCCVLRSGMTR